jgi:MFS transporter, SP family, arabinose:H+ symporter
VLNTRSAEAYSNARLYFVSCVAAAGGFNWSYDILLMSGAILYVKNYFKIGNLNLELFSHHVSPSWIEGLAMTTGFWGTVVGMLVGSYLADRIGRKRSLVLGGILLLSGAVGTAVPSSLLIWNVFRLIGGIGGGLAILVAPMYISEIAPAAKRGSLVTFNQLAIVLGAFAANLSAFIIAKYFGSNPECWRWMFASGCVPTLLFLAGLFYIPDTPRWLLMQGYPEKARGVLTWVEGGHCADETIREINESFRQEKGEFRELFRPGMRIALVIAFGLAIFDQWVGVPTLIFYAPSLFVKAGISSNASAIGNTVILRIGDILWTLVAIYWVDRFGRRSLLLMGSVGIALGQFLMGFCFYRDLSPFFVLLAFFLCEGTFNVSLPPVGWLVTTEIFPTQLRARGMAIHGSLRFGSSLFLAQVFPPMMEFSSSHFGSEAGVFWLFSIVSISAFIFSLLLVPETKGKTLEQVSAAYGGR